MANQLSNLLTHVVEVLQEMPLVNTIVFKDDNVIDVEKENIYPLVSLELTSSPAPLSNLREYKLKFEVVNQRDDTKSSTQNKLMLDTNYIDNINICDSIANNFLLEITKSHNQFDINIDEGNISDFEFIRIDERNCLDGVKFDARFYLHQNNI